MNPIQPKCVVPLDTERQLYFDANQMGAFQKVQGRHFLDYIGEFQEGQFDAKEKFPDDEERRENHFLRGIDFNAFADFVWSACLEYDSRGEPSWPLSRGQIGRYITFGWMMKHLGKIFEAWRKMTPDKEDLPMRLRSEETTEVRPMTEAERSTRVDGGPPGGQSGDSTSGSATPTSAD